MTGAKTSSTFKALFWAVCFCAVVLFLTTAPQASARTVKAKVIVVNVSDLGGGEKITDADLINIALTGVKDDEKLFPLIDTLTLKSGEVIQPYSPGVAIPTGPLSFKCGLKQEMRLEFIPIKKQKKSGKYDMAVVGSDGLIRKYDKEIVIDNVNRTIKTYGTIDIKGGDVVLLFVRDAKVVQFNNVVHEGFSTECG